MRQKFALNATVIVPTYNRSSLLGFTLQALTQQTIPAKEFEVIVVDDGSSDNTREVVDRYRSLLNLHYYYQEDRGYRVSSARNIGIRQASGDICIFIDSGVMPGPTLVEEHIKSYTTESAIALIGYVYGFDQDNAYSDHLQNLIDVTDAGKTINHFEANDLFSDIRDPYYNRYEDQLENLPAPWIFYWTCNASALRRDLLEIGMFDECFDGIWGCEDAELAYRLFKHGCSMKLNRNATAVHFPHFKDAETKFRNTARNRIYFHGKHGSVETKMLVQLIGSDCIDLNERLLIYSE